MKSAKVDPELCIGCSLCCGICDSVFQMNEEGKAEAYQAVSDDSVDAVQDAIDSCPATAIDWD